MRRPLSLKNLKETLSITQEMVYRGPCVCPLARRFNMCGFTGFWQSSPKSQETLLKLAEAMASRIAYRGPDDQGAWCEASEGLVLGHRRLSIVDLSPLGHQPMVSESGQSVIAYNGEIYNTDALRRDLEALGKIFKSQTDTEVLLEGCEVWGVPQMVSKCIGMFAFAFWNRASKTLTLVRDRLGIKPLYYGRSQGTFFFGSQVRSFLPHPSWQGQINRQALAAYFRFNYIPAPFSIYEKIYKLRPGFFLEVKDGHVIREEAYWDLEKTVGHSLQSPCLLSESQQIRALEDLLKDAVQKRMVADVPLGAFLSGGIDSSLVVSLMQAQSPRPVKTFSIGFHEKGFAEAQEAKKVASHLKTDHHELYVSPQEAQAVIPRLSDFYDEPFADVSQIPTFLVSQLAREQVTVALSGDGGDELFGGYNRHLWGEKIWRGKRYCPDWVWSVVAPVANSLSPQTWTQIGEILPLGYFSKNLGDKVRLGLKVLRARSEHEFYVSLLSLWQNPLDIIKTDQEPCLDFFPQLPLSFLEKMQFADTQQYLPDDILTKVDRASMGVSLEARVPLLDHRVFDFAWRLPLSLKVRKGKGKWILRQILKKHVPEALFERPKMGFGVPIGDWMRGDLREWCEDLLSEKALEEGGFLNAAPIRHLWHAHLAHDQNGQYPLWSVLMFQMWRLHTLGPYTHPT